jgi:DNA recombination protein RmuC
MLETNFPKSQFELQHRFKEGQIVDAILKTKDGLISVDSKFPADSFRRLFSVDLTPETRAFEKNEFEKAVRKHITDIAKKYILPGEGTAEFAIMYVPSEAIFYEIISTSDELSQFAGERHIMMTSPNTMSYYLHILRLGQERTRIEEDAQKVWNLLSGLQQDFARFGEALRVAWGHVTNAKKTMDSIGNDFTQLSGKIYQIKQSKEQGT